MLARSVAVSVSTGVELEAGFLPLGVDELHGDRATSLALNPP
jgi:hypothetical protein